MRIITAESYSRVVQWWDRAINDVEIARFMSIVPMCQCPELSTDWEHILVMDGRDMGLMKISIDRTTGGRTAAISLWVLPCNNRGLIAGRLIKYGRLLLKQYGVKYADWKVHETNGRSLAISRKRGDSVGYKDDHAWDRLGCCWVGLHYFRALV